MWYVINNRNKKKITAALPYPDPASFVPDCCNLSPLHVSCSSSGLNASSTLPLASLQVGTVLDILTDQQDNLTVFLLWPRSKKSSMTISHPFCHGQDPKNWPWPSATLFPVGEFFKRDMRCKQAAILQIYFGPPRFFEILNPLKNY